LLLALVRLAGKLDANAPSDRTVMQTQAGDILLSHGKRWRVRDVKIWRSFPVVDENTMCWRQSVDDAIRDANQ